MLFTSVISCTRINDMLIRSEKSNAHGSEENKVKWGYSEKNGPDVWHQLSPNYFLCSEGKNQSPIDIVDAKPVKLPDVTFNYSPSTLNILNNGHAIEVKYSNGSYIEFEGTRYKLLQFHFHSPSEHTLSGNLFDVEMHLVHQSKDGKLAVVGVLIEKGNENKAFSSIWENLPTDVGKVHKIENLSINAEHLIPKKRFFYRYDGSLTTPPCSEGVKWMLLTEPIEMSGSQIEALRSIIHNNNRPVQPLNGRKLLVDVCCK